MSDGCQVSAKHFAEVQGQDARSGFVRTMPTFTPLENPGVFALDCEMCSTTIGNEVWFLQIAVDVALSSLYSQTAILIVSANNIILRFSDQLAV